MATTRANSKIARNLREAESLALRKRILKTGVLDTFDPNGELFKKISEAGDDYQQKLERLQSYKTASKEVSKYQTLKLEWSKEQEQLARLGQHIESDIAGAMEVLVLHATTGERVLSDEPLSSDNSEIHDLVDDGIVYQAKLRDHKKGIMLQLHEIKGMLAETVKAARRKNVTNSKSSNEGVRGVAAVAGARNKKTSLTITASKASSTTEKVPEPNAAAATELANAADFAVPIYAQLLVELRAQHSSIWEPLRAEEEKLFATIADDRNRITAMLREERIAEQAVLMATDLQIQEGDDAEVEMMVEEWLQKVHALDCSHRKGLRQLNSERIKACQTAVDTEDGVVCASVRSVQPSSEDVAVQNEVLVPVVNDDGDSFFDRVVDAEPVSIDTGYADADNGNTAVKSVEQQTQLTTADYACIKDVGAAGIDEQAMGVGDDAPQSTAAEGEIKHTDDSSSVAGTTANNREEKEEGKQEAQEVPPLVRETLKALKQRNSSRSIRPIGVPNGAAAPQQKVGGNAVSTKVSSSSSSSILLPEADEEIRIRVAGGTSAAATLLPAVSTDICGDQDLHTGEGDDVDNEEKYRFGGWTKEDHDMFSKIFRRAQLSGMSRKLLTENLRLQFGHKTDLEISKHEDWYRQVRAILVHKSELVASYEVSRVELLDQARSQLSTLRQAKAEALGKAMEQEEWELSRRALHERLEQMRIEKSERERVLAEERRLHEEAERLSHEQKELETRAEQDEMRERVEEYKRAQEQLREAQQRSREDAERQEAAFKKSQIDANRVHVEARQKQVADKEALRRKREQDAEAAEIRRLELLAKLAEQVPYWDALQEAKSKLDHITASAKGHEYFAQEDQGRGHLPMNGFGDMKIIRDARFRLATALRDAGVHHSEAAKYAVAAMHPRPQLAIHGLL